MSYSEPDLAGQAKQFPLGHGRLTSGALSVVQAVIYAYESGLVSPGPAS
jgi:hypothetical protein